MITMRGIGIAVVTAMIMGRGVQARAQNQEAGSVALDIGTSAPWALLWKVNEDFALRPDFMFAHINTGDLGSSWRFGAGASALASVHRAGPLTTYLGARGGYVWYSESNAPTDWSVAGIFGARFALDPHFGISGETGIAYDRLRVSDPSVPNESIVQPWGRLSVLLFF